MKLLLFPLLWSLSLSAQQMSLSPLHHKRDGESRLRQGQSERLKSAHFTKSTEKSSHQFSTQPKPFSKITGGGVDTAWVRHYASGLEPSCDYPTAVAVDGSGNVYVTGKSYSSGAPYQFDYATIKYNSNGDILWVRRYDVRGGFALSAISLAVDRSGNVYVTGGSSSANSDFVTIKYNSNGDTLWVRTYDGPGNGDDFVRSLAVDESGNVYVTGTSYSLATSNDFATIKYNSNGDMLWVRRYNGPGNSDDDVRSLAVDGSGNVFVTGKSAGLGTASDYATVKYNANGDTLWVKRFNGPGNSIDEVSSLAIDEGGNVYVTGVTYRGSSGPAFKDSSDYATIKYNSNGDTLWVRTYNRSGNRYNVARSLAVDGSGNVYVTGTTGTIKYNNNGVQQWEVNASAIDITLDASGNVYVMGSSGEDYATIKYNSNGDTLWVREHNGLGNGGDDAICLAVDGSGNAYVTGAIGSFQNADYATIKSNSDGDTLWVRTYNGPEYSHDYASSLAIDAIGNVYVTGTSYGLGTSNDYATIKYNSNGDTLWVRRYNGPGGAESASSLAVDGSGNVYVTGESVVSGSFSEYATIKYNSNGDTLWVRRYNGLDASYYSAHSLAVDGNGNVYVTGSTGGTSNDYATIKYNSNGDTLWARRYNGPGNGIDNASSLAVDGSGNVFVTGESVGSTFPLSNYATIKYNSNGDTLWVRRYKGPGNSGDGASSLAIDGNGYVYITGRSSGDYATIKYNSNGDTLWVRRYNGTGNRTDVATSLAVDGKGNVYVTGMSIGSGTSYDFATIKYNSNGDTLWIRRYNGPGNSIDFARSLAVDGAGNVYITGESVASDTISEYVTLKYSSAGDEEWVARYSSGASDVPCGIRVDKTGNVYVGGSSTLRIGGSTIFSVYTTIKYVQSPTLVKEIHSNVPSTFALGQNFPNPFNPSTVIRYQLPVISNVSLRIYDLLGREVATLVNEEQSPGWKEVKWNASGFASGIYLVRMQAGHFSDTKKILLMK